jgi:hypothetical protein
VVKEEADSLVGDATGDVLLGIFTAISLLVNTIAIAALFIGRGARNKPIEGLLAMYNDNQVSQYYDSSLLTNYGRRYMIFMDVSLVSTGIVVPLVIRFL